MPHSILWKKKVSKNWKKKKFYTQKVIKITKIKNVPFINTNTQIGNPQTFFPFCLYKKAFSTSIKLITKISFPSYIKWKNSL